MIHLKKQPGIDLDILSGIPATTGSGFPPDPPSHEGWRLPDLDMKWHMAIWLYQMPIQA